LLLFTPAKGFSQGNSDWSVDIGLTQTYPGFFNLYKGSVDMGTDYRMKLKGNLFAGAGFWVQFLKLNGTQSKTVVYKPKLNLEYRFGVSKSFGIVPSISAGYSFMNLKNNEYGYSSTRSGINISPGLRFVWKTKLRTDFYVYGRYDYIKLAKDEEFTKLDYYRNVNLSSFGIGVIIKQKKYGQPEKY